MNDLTITNSAKPSDPRFSPSYPARVHSAERPQWNALLAEWKGKVAAATARMSVLGNHPKRGDFEFVSSQMQGALDQIADCIRRLPGEVGDLYEEDKHKVDQAVAALGRLLQRWDTLG